MRSAKKSGYGNRREAGGVERLAQFRHAARARLEAVDGQLRCSGQLIDQAAVVGSEDQGEAFALAGLVEDAPRQAGRLIVTLGQPGGRLAAERDNGRVGHGLRPITDQTARGRRDQEASVSDGDRASLALDPVAPEDLAVGGRERRHGVLPACVEGVAGEDEGVATVVGRLPFRLFLTAEPGFQVVGADGAAAAGVEDSAVGDRVEFARELAAFLARPRLETHNAVVLVGLVFAYLDVNVRPDVAPPVEEKAVGDEGPRASPAVAPTARLGAVVEEFPGPAVVCCGDVPPRRHEQQVVPGQEIALRADARHRERPRMWLLEVEGAAGGVLPENLPGVGLQGIDDHALRGPHSRGDVNDPVHDSNTGTQRPARDHALIAQEHLVAGRGAKTPQQLPLGGGQTIEPAVVGGHEHPLACDLGGEAHGGACEKLPAHAPARQVEGVDLVVGGGAVEDQATRDGGHVGVVECQAVEFAPGLWPGRHRAMPRHVDPLAMERSGQFLAGHPAAGRVVAPGRPVLGQSGERNESEQRHYERCGLCSHSETPCRGCGGSLGVLAVELGA